MVATVAESAAVIPNAHEQGRYLQFSKLQGNKRFWEDNIMDKTDKVPKPAKDKEDKDILCFKNEEEGLAYDMNISVKELRKRQRLTNTLSITIDILGGASLKLQSKDARVKKAWQTIANSFYKYHSKIAIKHDTYPGTFYLGSKKIKDKYS